MVLKLWQNGFSIDDGPLREYQDPANQEFLSAIKRGLVLQPLSVLFNTLLSVICSYFYATSELSSNSSALNQL